MILLRGSRAGALDAHEERIRSFADLYPGHWGTLARADDVDCGIRASIAAARTGALSATSPDWLPRSS